MTNDSTVTVYGTEQVKRARIAVAAVFTVHGAVTGSFATRVPWIQDHAGVSAGQLGLALAFPAIGASIAMPLGGRISHRFGARTALRGLLTLWTLALILPALSPNLLTLCAALFVYGATAGMSDVAMNALGVEVENRLDKSISVGAARHVERGRADRFGGGHGRGPHRDRRPDAPSRRCPGAHGTGPDRLPGRPRHPEQPGRGTSATVHAAAEVGPDHRGGRILRGVRRGRQSGLVGGLPADVLDSSDGLAAASTTAFALMMAVARIAGDRIVDRFGAVRTVRTGGVMATAGGLLVVFSPSPAAAMCGFALLGLGVAVVVPLAFAAAGRSGPNPSQAIAGVATITYTSGLIAPRRSARWPRRPRWWCRSAW